MKRKRIVSVLVFCFLVILMIAGLDRMFARTYSYEKYGDYYKEKQNIDVLFFGTSHMINGVFPMEIWDEYGIVSYNMANHSETICVNYWQLKEALKRNTPKVVVVDLYAIGGTGKSNLKYTHNLTDAMPLSMNKIRMVMDVIEPGQRAEYLFPLSLYHSRWDDDLTKEDLIKKSGVQKGAELRTDVYLNEIPVIIEKSERDLTENVNKEYLERMITLCQEKGIAIVLTYLPYAAPVEDQFPANYGYELAEKYQIPYVNMLYEDVIDYRIDGADEGSHLNMSGAKKVSSFLGAYLLENYELSDQRENKKYEKWHADLTRYQTYKRSLLESQKELYPLLVQLYDRHYSVEISYREDSVFAGDFMTKMLIQNLIDVSVVVTDATEEFSEDNRDQLLIQVVDKESGDCVFSGISFQNDEGVFCLAK